MYLDDLDELLRAGASALSPELRRRQCEFVLARQRPDGGFAGRQGPSDLYYTDFALRILSLVGAEGADLSRIGTFAATGVPRDVIESFSLLNCDRMLRDLGMSVPKECPAASSALAAWRVPSGGFARRGGAGASAYATFLAALCFEMLGEPFPDAPAAGAALAALQRPDGGFADLASGAAGQTSASAAALAFLTLTGALTSPDARAVKFLCSMQDGPGGFRASAEAPESDLLSTFTALVTLFALDGFKQVNLAAAARWIGRLAGENGGFRASPSDAETDLEYTCYGLGALSLLRAYAGLMK